VKKMQGVIFKWDFEKGPLELYDGSTQEKKLQ
jgi:hypothetical protein